MRKGVPEPDELVLAVPVLAALLAEADDELDELEEPPQAASTMPITAAAVAAVASFFAAVGAA
jgi:hypothetical protein